MCKLYYSISNQVKIEKFADKITMLKFVQDNQVEVLAVI